MKFLDFLFYFFALYFNKKKNSLNWSTPEERAAYALHKKHQ